MRPSYRPIVLLSGCTNDADYTDRLDDALHTTGLEYDECTGFYGGFSEASFIVFADNQSVVDYLLDLAKHLDQESILYLDEERRATLLYTDGRVERLDGRFQRVDSALVKNLEGYTFYKNHYYGVL